MKILLVSDKNSTTSIVNNIVTSNDELTVVDNGKNIVKQVNENDVDVIICDFQVGAMGGIAIAIEIESEQEMGNCKEIPILLLLDRKVDNFLAERTSCQYLAKPFSIFELKEKLDSIIIQQVKK